MELARRIWLGLACAVVAAHRVQQQVPHGGGDGEQRADSDGDVRCRFTDGEDGELEVGITCSLMIDEIPEDLLAQDALSSARPSSDYSVRPCFDNIIDN